MFIHLARTAATTALALVVVISATCGSTNVHAQDGAQSNTNERLRACDRIDDTMEKLACFDAVVKGLDQAPVTPSVASPSSPATTEAAPATRASDDAASSSATEAAATAAIVAPVATEAAPATPAPDAAAGSSVAEAAATAAIVTPAVTETQSGTAEPALPATGNTIGPASGSASPEELFGLEDVTRKEAKDAKAAEKAKVKKEKQGGELESLQATVVDAWPTIDGRFEVQLDNGQVWRETERTRIGRLPKEGTQVVISKAVLGGYRMKIGNNNRLAGVRRTK
jgi:hypothetical protein